VIHAVLLAYLMPRAAGACAPKTISYVSAWQGLGTPRSATGTLAPSGPKVARVVRAILAERVTDPSATQLGLTASVFAPFVHLAPRWMFGPLGDERLIRRRVEALYLDPRLRAAFVRRVVLPPGIVRVVTDTYPHEEVDVTCEDGRVARASSSQNASTFMLPWTVSLGGRTFQTFNAEIPRSIAALMGPSDVNAGYISDEGMARAYVDGLRAEYLRRYGQPAER